MMSSNWHLCVLIPACNEEKLLPRCLYSVLASYSKIMNKCTFDIILIVDASTDRTYEIGKKILGDKGIVIKIKKANVGYARKYATEIALNRYKGSLEHCWLANTDADCIVPINWLKDQIKLAKRGIQSIAGIIKVDNFSEHTKDAPIRFLNSYTINPDGTHPHIHGANLGIRADIYKRVGGWKNLKTGEDHDLRKRLSEAGVFILSDANIFVFTSGRKIGRAPNGFANKLSTFDGE